MAIKNNTTYVIEIILAARLICLQDILKVSITVFEFNYRKETAIIGSYLITG